MKRTGFLTVFALLFLFFSLMAKPYYVIEMVKLKEKAAGMPEENVKVHDHPSFRKNVHLRNSSFSGFTEALGRVKK